MFGNDQRNLIHTLQPMPQECQNPNN